MSIFFILTTQEGVGGFHSHGNFFAPSTPSPQSPSLHASFFTPAPLPPSHATPLWKGGSGKFVFTPQSLFQT